MAKEFVVVQALGNVAQGKLLSELLSDNDGKRVGGKAIILADEKLLIPALQTIR